MRIGFKPENRLNIGTLCVYVKYPTSEVSYDSILRASTRFTTDDLESTEFREIVLPFTIDGLPENIKDRQYSGGFGGTEALDLINTRVIYEINLDGITSPVEYGHLYIDKITVTDEAIWNNYSNRLDDILNSYHTIWDSTDTSSVYRDKIKYFYTMDEPHSYDHYIPYREVEAVQKTLSFPIKDKLMLTKIYPEWDGYKEGLNVIDTWAEVVQPRKLMFWYYTIFNSGEGTYISQLQLRTRLQEAVAHDKDFFYTAQTFGSRKLNYIGVVPPEDFHYHKYRTPTGNQVLGQSMLALAYGCKGLFYETYYSYLSNTPDWGDYFAESLVGEYNDPVGFEKPRLSDFGLYDTIVSLGKRLKGPLGNFLPKLEFSGEESYIYDEWNGGRVPREVNPTKLRIFGDGIPVYPSSRMINLGVTRLQSKNEYHLRGDYYFLLNQTTFDGFNLPNNGIFGTYNKLHVGLSVTGLLNWRFYDIEGGNDFRFENNSTGIDFTVKIPIGKGDGRLYRLISIAASTGTFLTDEVITSGEIISSEGTIKVPTGVTLKIEGNYTLTDSLIIEGGGDLWFGNNTLTGTQEGVGLTLTGCFGNIYNNKIANHTDGILLADSYPKIGGNEITNNTQRGLVCEYGAIPDLKTFNEAGLCEQMNTYPLSGFNRISNNGTNAGEEGFEIFLDNSSIEMMNGTNEVSDANFNPLISGKYMLERVDLSGNYWGTETIIDEMLVLDNPFTYSPVLTGFAPVISTDCPFIITLNSLSFTDTLHRINNGILGTGGERAERYMAEGQYDSAYTEFQSMSLISEDTTSINTESLRGMYRSGKLGNNKETKLFQLTTKTDSLLSTVTDTNAIKSLNKLKVYIEADNNNIPTAQILAAQNTTNAITATDQYHAQTEELTIALRGTTLNRNMKNDVGSITTMNRSGINNLMKRHSNKFTIKKEPKQAEVITEYSLSQNYPNPFNSSTIIEYALPKEGLVSMKLYDITGRLVKQLVNEQKPSGRHKTTIESGNLASGVYIYSLRVNDININKKLVVLK